MGKAWFLCHYQCSKIYILLLSGVLEPKYHISQIWLSSFQNWNSLFSRYLLFMVRIITLPLQSFMLPPKPARPWIQLSVWSLSELSISFDQDRWFTEVYHFTIKGWNKKRSLGAPYGSLVGKYKAFGKTNCFLVWNRPPKLSVFTKTFLHLK